jgi:predicted alpha/beta hydrolase family esterase
VSTADVVGVHGISQQQSGRHQLLKAWQPALADGVDRATGGDGPEFEFDLAYYGNFFLAATTDKGITDKAIGAGDLEALDDDMVEFFGNVENEVVDEEPTKEEAAKELGELLRPVSRLAAWLDRRFGVLGRGLFFGDLVQVRRYQRDDDLAAAVRFQLEKTIGTRTRVLIGHSLGSLVAYEYLCLHPDSGVDTLITLGSPLALRSIQDSLRTAGADGRPMAPPGLVRWVNVRDRSDPVSCGGGLSATWSAVADELVDNGDDPHAATRYLGKKETGAAVLASFPQ